MRDAPQLELRGFHFDLKSSVPTLEYLMETVDTFEAQTIRVAVGRRAALAVLPIGAWRAGASFYMKTQILPRQWSGSALGWTQGKKYATQRAYQQAAVQKLEGAAERAWPACGETAAVGAV
ncbi:hypothetical protein M3223_19350 [Paenibacillus pasadenensis]|uniref:hypothetical protein n=1 Tax=Paenibacillus pasadenensis TaxID=217090 RepID=UPI00203FB49D|nr:hypothetical protein [Paenibacillus pasadenensis]MCM3749513.1 hypothetical protein [Paenibacillus pasadenensis]